ncbi:MAG TPA: glycosyltransferase family 4 protein [Phormidium sp.]
MKVLHINQSDIYGGAAIAAYRLHRGLLEQNIESSLLVDNAKLDDDLVRSIERRRYVENLNSRLLWHLGLNNIGSISTFNFVKKPYYEEANVLNLHNLHGDYFNYLAIPVLTRNKPTVLTLHDMWAFTGHCAYSYDCERWMTGCGHCPYPEVIPAIRRDLTHVEWLLKKLVYRSSSLAVVAPSKWLFNLVGNSLLKKFPVYHIPHGLDIRVYQPLEKEMSRRALGIPTQKKVLMFGAQTLKDFRKGSDLLVKALNRLSDSLKSEILLLTVGEADNSIIEATGIENVSLGYISGDRLKTIAYSAADIFVLPTRADIFGLVLQESMACGTPLVSFRVGGVPELVRPGLTGLLAAPEDSKDFSERILELLEDSLLREKMSVKCREVAVSEYSIELQVKSYLSLYNNLLGVAENSST